MKKNVKIIRDLDAIKMAVEDTRHKIASLLMVDDMTISQLSEALGKDQSTIYRHLKKLEEAGFVEVTGERKIHHIPEKMYGRTAGIFLFSPDSDYDTGNVMDLPNKIEYENARWVIDSLKIMGYDIFSEDNLADLLELFLTVNRRIDDKIMEVEDEIKDINYLRLLYLKLILFKIELEIDQELSSKLEDILGGSYP